jgi:putative hydrolase of the HAD superfamily
MAVPPDEQQRESIRQFAHGIATEPVELLAGVRDTLEQLAQRHRLVLVTKGHPLEQRDKLRRSGLEPLFAHVEVLAEKHPAAYAELCRKHGWDAATCWMIGNSPKSDIYSALAAGLHAVHIPHTQTWILEEYAVEEPAEPQKLVRLERFCELAEMF